MWEPLSRDLGTIKKVDLNKMLSPILRPGAIKQLPLKSPLPKSMLLETLYEQMYWFTKAELSELTERFGFHEYILHGCHDPVYILEMISGRPGIPKYLLSIS